MNFQALVIGNPGEPGEPARYYCDGVSRDLVSYPEFLRSPIGGAWRDSEITVLLRPNVHTVRTQIQHLRDADYSLVIFTGHGHTDPGTRSTILSLKRGHEIDSLELRRGAPKHTLILDCCRELAGPRIATDAALREERIAKAGLDSAKCRRAFEAFLNDCSPGLVVLHACRLDELANDDPAAGGYYSSSLLAATREWSRSRLVDPGYYYSLSVSAAHERAVPRVDGLSGGRQHPEIEKPRSDQHFPFGIVA